MKEEQKAETELKWAIESMAGVYQDLSTSNRNFDIQKSAGSMNSYSRGLGFENYRSGSLSSLNSSVPRSTSNLTRKLRENAATIHRKEQSEKRL